MTIQDGHRLGFCGRAEPSWRIRVAGMACRRYCLVLVALGLFSIALADRKTAAANSIDGTETFSNVDTITPNDAKNDFCSDAVSAISSSLDGYIIRAVCPHTTLYLQVHRLLKRSCTVTCKCEPVRFDSSNQGDRSLQSAASGQWTPISIQAAGWRFPAIYIGNATIPGLDKRWTSQVHSKVKTKNCTHAHIWNARQLICPKIR